MMGIECLNILIVLVVIQICHVIKYVHVHHGELQMRAVVYLIVLYQSQFPNFNNVLWLFRM